MVREYLLAQDVMQPSHNGGEVDPIARSPLRGVETAIRVLEEGCESIDVIREWDELWKDQ